MRLKEIQRRKHARDRAEEYAPRPIDSLWMYGVVGVGLAGIALIAFSQFFGLDAFAYPLVVVLALMFVFAGSIILRLVRSRRHENAYHSEYDRNSRS